MASKQEYIDKYGNAAKIFFNLTDKGISFNGACGVLGNIQAESNFNPGIVEHGSGIGYGLCQWSFGRRTTLNAYAVSKGKKVSDLDLQCDFLYKELTESYKAVLTELEKKDTTPEKSADIFVRKFERPANVDKTSIVRQRNAKEWADKMSGAPGGGGSSGGGLEVHPEKLFSSDNYEYIDWEKKKSRTYSKAYLDYVDSIKTGLRSLRLATDNITAVLDSAVSSLIDAISQAQADSISGKVPTKRKKGLVASTSLPTSISYVESPYVSVTIGGRTIGIKNGSKYPDYIQGIKCRKTNGSVNEYQVSLVHQIAPGDNPNYIDELISKTGYNEIILTFGDSHNNVNFRDVKCMITNVTTAFDFVGSRITYTIFCTSFALLSSTSKYTYPARKDKPSNVIREVLYNKANSNLLEAFPNMRSKSYVESKGYLPNNDKVVNIDEVSNTNPFNYLVHLVSLMQNESDKSKSSYYLSVEDSLGVFKVLEVDNNITNLNSQFMYEVNVGYPDNNQVYDFSAKTNYAWAMAYKSDAGINNYKYTIDSVGELHRLNTRAIYKNNSVNSTGGIQSYNLWEQLTSYPIQATLTCRGLVKPLLLLQYVKINVIFQGSTRITSGVYIVTQQDDTLDSQGFRTTLSLLRVAGDDEYLNTDGRVLT